MANVNTARMLKTALWNLEPDAMHEEINKRIVALVRKAERMSLKPVCRLNGTSDRFDLVRPHLAKWPNVQFMDYTKHAKPWKRIAPNYHLTFSRSETNRVLCRDALAHGINVAVVFANKVPDTFWNLPVINGDAHDLRFLDDSPCIVGLKAKGAAKNDRTGFVVR